MTQLDRNALHKTLEVLKTVTAVDVWEQLYDAAQSTPNAQKLYLKHIARTLNKIRLNLIWITTLEKCARTFANVETRGSLPLPGGEGGGLRFEMASRAETNGEFLNKLTPATGDLEDEEEEEASSKQPANNGRPWRHRRRKTAISIVGSSENHSYHLPAQCVPNERNDGDGDDGVCISGPFHNFQPPRCCWLDKEVRPSSSSPVPEESLSCKFNCAPRCVRRISFLFPRVLAVTRDATY